MSSTSEEVWQLLRELVRSQQETDRQLQETDRQIQEVKQMLREQTQETERLIREQTQETDRRFRELAEEAARQRQERAEADERYRQERAAEEERRMQERAEADERYRQERAAEEERRMQEEERRRREVDQQLKELGRQIGGLGAKFGSFTEGLALPSMERILRERFGMECVGPRVRRRKNGQEIEIDVLAYANSDRQAVYVVEVKSHPREEAIDQMKRLLQRFQEFFPEHQDKELYGILAAVSLPEALRQQILAEGLYVAQIDDEVFALDVPEDFQARSWS